MWIKYWPQALLAVLLAAAMWYAHHRGFQTAFGRQQAVIAQIKAEQQAQALAAEQAYTAKLAEVQKLPHRAALRRRGAQRRHHQRRRRRRHGRHLNRLYRRCSRGLGGIGAGCERQYRQCSRQPQLGLV